MDASHKDDFRSLAVGNSSGSSANPVVTDGADVFGANNDSKSVTTNNGRQTVAGQYGGVENSPNGGDIGTNVAAVGYNTNINVNTSTNTPNINNNTGVGVNNAAGNGVANSGTTSILGGGVTNNTVNSDNANVAGNGSTLSGGIDTNLAINGNVGANGVSNDISGGTVVNDDSGYTEMVGIDQGGVQIDAWGNAFTKKRGFKKKWLFIALGGGVLLLVVVLVVFLLSNNSSSKRSGMISDFERFANFVLYGEDSDKALTDSYDANKNYYFLGIQGTEEDKTIDYEKAGVLYSEFFERYEKIPKGKILKSEQANTVLDRFVRSEKNLLGFMERVYIKELANEPVLLEQYVSGGKDTAMRYYMDYYGLSGDSDNEFVRDFVEALTVWSANEVELFEYFSSKGCLGDGFLNYACMFDNGDADLQTMRSFRERIDNSLASLRYYYDYSDDLVYNVYVIEGLLNGKDVSDLVIINMEESK